MPLSSEGATRSFQQNVTLAVVLAGVAGAVNAAGFFLVGLHTSHMTGKVAAVGEVLGQGAGANMTQSLGLLAAFVAGAASAAVTLDLIAFRRARYTVVLALEALALGACALCACFPAWSVVVPATLCFAMGLQNALVTRISGAIVRTTHLTGVLTDFGIECVRVVRWLWATRRARDARGASTQTGRLSAQLERALLHVALVLAFLGGATAGSLLVSRLGSPALVVPALALVALMLVDLRASALARGAKAP